MGRDLASRDPEVADFYRRAGDIVGYDLASLCFDGPADRLDSTEFSQPAIFVTSAACLGAIRRGTLSPELSDVTPDACLGLSLGEYSALYAAGAIDFADALRLVQLRGRAMQAAAKQNPGSMVSILGLDERTVERLCDAVLAEIGDSGTILLAPVNFNCPGQIVLSGSSDACLLAAQRASQFGAQRAIPLRVAGAFHTGLMEPAAAELKKALEQCHFAQPEFPVLANVDARRYDSPDRIGERLIRQLVSPVRWQQSVESLLDEGFERFVEIGPGRVLTGLAKKISRARKLKPTIITVNGMAP